MPNSVSDSAGTILVRRVRAAELKAVRALARSTPMAAHWLPAAFEAYCFDPSQKSEAQAKALFVACSAATGMPIGFAAFSALAMVDPSGAPAAECELANMAVAAEWRRQGVGKRLLHAGMLWCSGQSGTSLWLEVRASNRGAIALYEQTGFIVSGRRTAYYADPPDDAILMHKKLF